MTMLRWTTRVGQYNTRGAAKVGQDLGALQNRHTLSKWSRSSCSSDEFARMDVSVEFARALETGADFIHIRVDQVGEIEVMK
jgi:hypothetical protein